MTLEFVSATDELTCSKAVSITSQGVCLRIHGAGKLILFISQIGNGAKGDYACTRILEALRRYVCARNEQNKTGRPIKCVNPIRASFMGS